ncbi:class I SAM-dependent methyltransferase [Pedobacter sp. SD-b]|uniref:Class I SAM-dependent methyltransferase n=1 Tax=Pedobacter segetis TaxID=2793069 RepID=A0ABS1BJH8_9SPHI|nr:class I SAM-dependent methyltransferase [Pedobacter segetis]MBK0383045.1 class I SAM-dependent methyltransferase [Pedobacter segetis]
MMSCPLCNSSKNKFNFNFGKYQLLSCENCGLHYINPYEQKDYDRNPLSLDKQYEGEIQSVKYFLPLIAKHIINKNSVIDIGCGCGAFLKECKRLGVKKIVGIENDFNRAKYARKITNGRILETEIQNYTVTEKFDVAVLINVISHIPDLKAFFLRIDQLLKPKGLLIIKTGLMKKGFRKINGFDWNIPEHIQFIGEPTPEYISQKFNFNLKEKLLISLAEDLLSKQYLLSPGRYGFINLTKKIIFYFPFARVLIKKLYNLYTKNRLFTSILVYEKR